MNRAERDQLVLKHLPLVGFLAREVHFTDGPISREDLASAGTVALVQCANSFDPDRGVPFTTFARTRITGAFADEMRRDDMVGRSARTKVRELKDVEADLSASLGRTPTIDELAYAMGVDRSAVEAIRVDAEVTRVELSPEVCEVLAIGGAGPEEAVVDAERDAYIRVAVQSLPERLRHVITEIYFNDRSGREVAAELGVTEVVVSQLRAEAMRLLQEGLNHQYHAVVPAAQPVSSRQSRRTEFLAAFGSGTLSRVHASMNAA